MAPSSQPRGNPPAPAWGSYAILLALLLLLAPSHLAPSSPGRAISVEVTAGPPVTIVLQPDSAAGMDTFLLNRTPLWNYGNNASLRVGLDVANASRARSMLQFDLSPIPSNATLLNATLGLYRTQGGAGTLQVERATAPWTEGTGLRSSTRVPVEVRETAGVNRTLEPIGVPLTFPLDSIGDPARDLRVYSGAIEIPSQVYRYTYAGSQVTGAEVWFEATVGAFGTRWFNITYGTSGASVPAYRTRTLGSTPLWYYNYTGGGASGVTVADVDGDGRLEMVFGTANGVLTILDDQHQVKRQFSVSTYGIPYTPQVADMDRDGVMDIVFLANDPAVMRYDVTGRLFWIVNYTVGSIPTSAPTLLDVNRDGILDVLVSGKFGSVRALDGRNGNLILEYNPGSTTYGVALSDVNGDGSAELFFGADDKKLHAFRQSGTEIWSGPANASFIESTPSLGDVNNDGAIDVVNGVDTSAAPEFALRATDGATVWFSGTPDFLEGGQTLADINGDGILDVIFGVYTRGTFRAVRGDTGAVLWSNQTFATQPMYPAVLDLDKDGRPEAVWMDIATTVAVVNSTGVTIRSWTVPANDPGLRTLSQLEMATPAVADVDGDGTMEIIVPTGTGIQAYGTGGLSHDWRTWGYNWNHTSRALDGNSPDGAPFLQATLGLPAVLPAPGASWSYRDGSVAWATPGGDAGGPEANASSSPGWVEWNITGMAQDWHSGAYPNIGLFVLAANEGTGPVHVFSSSDDVSAALRPRLTVTYVLPVVDPNPYILGPLPNLVRAEDSPPWSLDLSSLAADGDTSSTELRWNLTGEDPSKVSVTGLNVPGNHVLTFYPQKDAWGSMYVTYWLTDPDGHWASRTAWLNLTPVNDAPTFSPPPSLVVKFNQTYTFDYGPYISDVDTPFSSLRLSSGDPARAAVSAFNVTFLYPESLVGQWVFVALTVSDGSLSSTRVVAVKVTSDSPPVLTRPLPDVTMTEGQTLLGIFDLDDYFTDPNNDALFFSYGYSHLNITIHANHTVDIRADAEWSGVERVTFRGTDPYGALAEDTIIVTVLPVDDPPVLGPVPDLRVRYDAPYVFNLDPYISDPDTVPSAINVSVSSPYVTVSGHLLTFLYPFALNNTVQDLTIWIGDGVSIAFRTIRVAVGEDWPPYVRSKLPDRSFNEDASLPNAYNLALFFDDPDSSALFYSSGNRSVRVTISGIGVVDLGAEPNWYGTERITFRATDSLGALAEDTVWIVVNSVDDVPYFLPIPDQVLNHTVHFVDLFPYLRDIDTNVSFLNLTTSNPHARILGQGILLEYTSDTVEEVEVEVSDGTLTNATTIHVTVTLPRSTTEIPPWLLWLLLGLGVASLVAFVFYRHRQIEWAFLVTNAGILVSSVCRRKTTSIDPDLVTGMLTAIMDFARKSFSEEKERDLEGLSLGDRRVAIVRGDRAFVAIVYRGHTPGSMLHHMRSFLALVEARYPRAVATIVDSSFVGEVTPHLQKLVERGAWPIVLFPKAHVHADRARAH